MSFFPRSLPKLIIAAMLPLAAAPALATLADQTLYWDPSGSNTQRTGGSGTWNTSPVNSWYEGEDTTRVTWVTGTGGTIASYWNLVFGGEGQTEPYTVTTNLSDTLAAGAAGDLKTFRVLFEGDYLLTKSTTQTNVSRIGGSGNYGHIEVSVAEGKTLEIQAGTDTGGVNRIAFRSAATNSSVPSITLTGGGTFDLGLQADIVQEHSNGQVRIGTPGASPTVNLGATATLTTPRLQVASGTVNLNEALATISGATSARGNSAIIIGGAGSATDGFTPATVNLNGGLLTAVPGVLRIDTNNEDRPWGMGAHGVAFAANPVSSSITSFNDYVGGTFNLNGAELVTTNLFANPFATEVVTARFVFNGGTLRVAAAATQDHLDQFIFGFGSSATHGVEITTAGAVIDTGAIDPATTNGIAVASSGLTGEGGLTKLGANTLRLDGTNTYTGPTRVSGGALLLGGSGSLASAVEVEAGATSGGAGTFGGAVTVRTGGAFVADGFATAQAPVIFENGVTMTVRLGSRTEYGRVSAHEGLAIGDANLVIDLRHQPVGASVYVLVDNRGGANSVTGQFRRNGTPLNEGDTFVVEQAVDPADPEAGTYLQEFLFTYAYAGGGFENSVALIATGEAPPQGDYATWRMDRFGSDTSPDGEPAFQPIGQPVPNLLLHALGLDLIGIVAEGLPQAEGEGTLRFTRRSTLATRLVVEATDDLASGNWTPIATLESGEGSWSGEATVDEVPIGTELLDVTITDSGTSTTGARFLRVRAELP